MKKKGLVVFGSCEGVLSPFPWEKLFEAYQSISDHSGIDFSQICWDMERFKTWFSHDLKNNMDRLGIRERDAIIRMNNLLHLIHGHGDEIFDWVPEITQKLKMHYNVAVLSSRTTDSLAVSLGEAESQFDAVVGCDKADKSKLDPNGLHALMRQFGVKAGNTVLIGHTNIDILAGQKCGIPTAAVGWGATSKPHHLIALRVQRILTEPQQIMLFAMNYAM